MMIIFDVVFCCSTSWFGFMIGIRPHTSIRRDLLPNFLILVISTIVCFSVLLRQPVVQEQLKLSSDSLRAPLTTGADNMSNTLFVGTCLVFVSS